MCLGILDFHQEHPLRGPGRLPSSSQLQVKSHKILPLVAQVRTFPGPEKTQSVKTGRPKTGDTPPEPIHRAEIPSPGQGHPQEGWAHGTASPAVPRTLRWAPGALPRSPALQRHLPGLPAATPPPLPATTEGCLFHHIAIAGEEVARFFFNPGLNFPNYLPSYEDFQARAGGLGVVEEGGGDRSVTFLPRQLHLFLRLLWWNETIVVRSEHF